MQALMKLLALSGVLTVESIARELDVSCRTFQRRLCEQDLTFRSMQAEVRLELAVELLRRTEMPVQEIARQLGHSKPGAFARAFTRWTGLSPRAYRRSHAR